MTKTNFIEDGYVSMEEDDCDQSLENKIDLLTQLMCRMTSRLDEVEKELSEAKRKQSLITKNKSLERKFSKRESEGVSCGGAITGKTDKYVLFEKGEVNPKGGVYTFDHLTKVYLMDEKTEATVIDETRCYFRVRVGGESYSQGSDGRLKRKCFVKRIRADRA